VSGAAFGLNGTFTGSCIACMTGTDTGVAFIGDTYFQAAGLVALGVPIEEASATISEFPAPFDQPMQVRVCQDCADRSKIRGLRVGLLAHGQDIPCFRQAVTA
jgi:hypothetical protein